MAAVVVAVVVAVIELGANLAAGELRAVHVRVRPAGANQAEHFLPLPCRDPVVRRRLHVGRSQRARDRAGAKVPGIVGGAVRRGGTRRLIEARFAQPQDDAVGCLRMADVNVRLPDVAFEILEGQLVLDRGRVCLWLILALKVPVAVVARGLGASLNPLRNSRNCRPPSSLNANSLSQRPGSPSPLS